MGLLETVLWKLICQFLYAKTNFHGNIGRAKILR